MKDFAALYGLIDQTTKTNTKVAALADYFRTAPDADRLWTIALFSGRRPRRAITTTKLREWAAERAGIPLWLFEEAYPIVGDLAETIALVFTRAALTPDALTLDAPRPRAPHPGGGGGREGGGEKGGGRGRGAGGGGGGVWAAVWVDGLVGGGGGGWWGAGWAERKGGALGGGVRFFFE